MSAPVRVVHSIINCRILLNLRRAASPRDGSTAISSIILAFAPAPEPETDQADTIRLEVRGGEEDSRLEVSSWDTICNR